MYQIYHILYHVHCTVPYTMYLLLCMAIIKVCTFLCVWDPHGFLSLTVASGCCFYFYCQRCLTWTLSREMWLRECVNGWLGGLAVHVGTRVLPQVTMASFMNKQQNVVNISKFICSIYLYIQRQSI